ncbi:MAG: 3-dehydroquinate synthase [Brevinematia bacterium]
MKFTVNVFRNEDLSYPIYIGKDILQALVEEIKVLLPSSLVVVTDNIVKHFHMDLLVKYLDTLLIPYHVISVPSGEKHKNRKTKEIIENEMLRLKIDRKALIIAFGGGVVGDIAGFVAATYHRGISYIQLPTTLLAMVDSSIGGKTGVDTPYGKNTIGAFYQPKAVIMELRFLDTLPCVHFKNGLVEVLKHSIIRDKNFYNFLRANHESIMSRDEEVLERTIEWSCRIKKEIVESDEREEGLRKILNFGHTVGHAIEAVSNYKILHGFAVSAGMVVESFISTRLGLLSEEDCISIVELLKLFSLPTTFKELGLKLSQKDFYRIVELMKGDKKSISKEIKISLPTEIGKMVDSFTVDVEPSIIIQTLSDVSNL